MYVHVDKWRSQYRNSQFAYIYEYAYVDFVQAFVQLIFKTYTRVKMEGGWFQFIYIFQLIFFFPKSFHIFNIISVRFLFLAQDIPLHVAMITHILIAWDRMRWLGDPLKGRFPAFVCCCATWLTGMVIALPYPIYTFYVEIGVSLY